MKRSWRQAANGIPSVSSVVSNLYCELLLRLLRKIEHKAVMYNYFSTWRAIPKLLSKGIAQELLYPYLKPSFHLNAIACVVRCVRCVNENRKKRKRLRWQAANHGCHCFDRAFLLAVACVCCVKRKRLRFLRFSFTQRTQRKSSP